MEDPSNQTDILSTDIKEGAGTSRTHRRFHKPLLIITVIIAVVFAVLIVFNVLTRPFNKTQNTYSTFTVEQGDDMKSVSAGLEKAGFIGSARAFRLTSSLILKSDFKPGTYYLSPSMDSVSIAKALTLGNVTTDGFIIPDGFTLSQTFSSLARDGFGDEDAFLRAAGDPYLKEIDFIGSDINGPQQVEGFLMPGTYRIDTEADEIMIIVTMLDSFSHFFNEDYQARADELGLSVREVVVIASMIEKETSIKSEKPMISSVIHNRINLGIIAPEDVPEIPLCSPGQDSIIAALYPSEDENIYYVLSDKLDGTHVFTSDEAEYKSLLDAYNAAKAAREEELDKKQSGAEDQDDNAADQSEASQKSSEEE